MHSELGSFADRLQSTWETLFGDDGRFSKEESVQQRMECVDAISNAYGVPAIPGDMRQPISMVFADSL